MLGNPDRERRGRRRWPESRRAIGTTIESAAGHSAATASSPAAPAIDAERERLLEVGEDDRQRLVVGAALDPKNAATPRSSVGSTASA